MRSPRPRRRAFTLLESLIALSILGMALFFFVLWIWQVWAAEKRVEIHRLALRELEAQNEAMRGAGAYPSFAELRELEPLTDLSRMTEAMVEAEGEELETPGLYELTVRVRYKVGPQEFTRTLKTLSWQP